MVRNLQNLKAKVLLLTMIFSIAVFVGCSGGEGTTGGDKSEIVAALERDYPPDKKSDGKTSNYELFKFEPLEETPEGAEKAWCVNFLFTYKLDANSVDARWIGFGNVVKKGGKYSYEHSTGCKLSDEEQKTIYELKNAG